MLDHMVVLKNFFSLATVPMYIPTNSKRGFQFLHNFTNICYLFIYLLTYLRMNTLRGSGLCFIVADLHFPDD